MQVLKIVKMFSNCEYNVYLLWFNSTSRPSHMHPQLDGARKTGLCFPGFQIHFIHRTLGWYLGEAWGSLQLPVEKSLLSITLS